MDWLLTRHPIFLALWALAFITCAIALWKGGRPERFGAALILTMAVLGAPIDTVFDEKTAQIAHLTLDFFLALGFLLVAIRYASLWLGGAMLFQAIQFSLHAYFFVQEIPHNLFYLQVNNVDFFGMLLCLLIGSIMTWRRRHARVQRAEQPLTTAP